MKGSDLETDNARTEVIYNFLHAINSLAGFLKSNEFIFVWDSRKSFRRDIYPEYKVKRSSNKTPEDIEFDELTLPQFQKIRMDVIPRIGFKNNFIQTGIEADDIIAQIVKDEDEQFVIVSSDGDLYQLFTRDFRVTMYSPTQKKYINHQTLLDDHGIEAEDWWRMKAITGCNTDNVAGIMGVGEKTAIKYLNGGLSYKSAAYKKIIDGEDIIKRNEKLVRLPFEGTKDFELIKDDISAIKFIEVFEDYNFKSFLRNDSWNEWTSNFKL